MSLCMRANRPFPSFLPSFFLHAAFFCGWLSLFFPPINSHLPPLTTSNIIQFRMVDRTGLRIPYKRPSALYLFGWIFENFSKRRLGSWLLNPKQCFEPAATKKSFTTRLFVGVRIAFFSLSRPLSSMFLVQFLVSCLFPSAFYDPVSACFLTPRAEEFWI